MIKEIRNLLIILLCSAPGGTFLLILVFALPAVVTGVWCLVRARNAAGGITVICLAAVALMPAAWPILTQNHTAIHCVYSFRITGVSVMALWGMTVSSVLTMRRGADRHDR